MSENEAPDAKIAGAFFFGPPPDLEHYGLRSQITSNQRSPRVADGNCAARDERLRGVAAGGNPDLDQFTIRFGARSAPRSDPPRAPTGRRRSAPAPTREQTHPRMLAPPPHQCPDLQRHLTPPPPPPPRARRASCARRAPPPRQHQDRQPLPHGRQAAPRHQAR